MYPVSEKVSQVSSIHFAGDITDHNWIKHLCKKTAKGESKVDDVALRCLARIVFYYRAVHVNEKEYCQRFEGSVLKMSYGELASMLGHSYTQIKQAITRLDKDYGVLKRMPVRNRDESGHVIGSDMYIDINVDRLYEITEITGSVKKCFRSNPHESKDSTGSIKKSSRPGVQKSAAIKDINNLIINIPPIVPPRWDELLSRSDELLELIKEHDIQHCGLKLEAEAFLTYYTSKPNDIVDWHAKFRGWFVNKAIKQIEEKRQEFQKADSKQCKRFNVDEDVGNVNSQKKDAQNKKHEMSGVSEIEGEIQKKTKRKKLTPKSEIKTGELFYLDSKKVRLTGELYTAFNKFWTVWGKYCDKASAARAFRENWEGIISDGKDVSINVNLESVLAAAKKEAERRPTVLNRGFKTMYAQGWLNRRRWENAPIQLPKEVRVNQNASSTRNLSTADIYEQQLYAAAAVEPAKFIDEKSGPGFCQIDNNLFDIPQADNGGW